MAFGKYIFFDGKFLPYQKALVPVTVHALHYGTGCFEGIRAYWNKEEKQLFIFKAQEHYQRLLNSIKIIASQINYTPLQLLKITQTLLRKNKHQTDTYIRPLYFKSEESVGNFNLKTLKGSLIIYTAEFGRYLGDLSKGIKICISSWRRVEDNAIPPRAKISGAYINTALAKTEALFNGYQEAIFLTNKGYVAEGSAENIFIIKNNQVFTPPVTDNILEGITRNTLIYLFKEELNILVKERHISRTELYTADEVFLCGTGAEITPVGFIDKRKIGKGKIGPLAQKIQKIFFAITRGKKKKYHHWLLSVY